MPNKNYQSGRNFEHRVKKHLENKGYYVMRSAGSRGQIDIVAIPTYSYECQVHKTLLIQCKHGTKISKDEREKLLDLDENLVKGNMCIVAWSKLNGKITFFAWAWSTNKVEWGEIEI